MDSLYSTFVLNRVLEKGNCKIKMIVLSDRYDGRYDSFVRQTLYNFRRGGIHLISFLSCVFVFHKILCLATQISIVRKLLKLDFVLLSIGALAYNRGIKVFKTAHINSGSAISEIKAVEPDLIISCYFDQLIGSHVYQIPSVATVNIHPGLLPDYRGPFPTFWTLLGGRRESAASVHFIDDHFDTGDIIDTYHISLSGSGTVLGADKIIFSKVPEIIHALANQQVSFDGRLQTLARAAYFSFPKKTDIKRARAIGVKLWCLRDFLSFARI